MNQQYISTLIAMAFFFVAMAHTVNGAATLMNAIGNLCSAVEHFVIRFRRLMKTIGGKVRHK